MIASTKNFIYSLIERGYVLSPVEGKIRVSGNEALPDSEREFIRQNKEAILRELNERSAVQNLKPSTDWNEFERNLRDWEKRILEYQSADFPFSDLDNPYTKEILLRHWKDWDETKRAAFVWKVQDIQKTTGYTLGNAVAKVLLLWEGKP